MLSSKFDKFLSFLKQQIRFSSNFLSLFSVMRHNSSILFKLTFYILSTKGAYQSKSLVKFHVGSGESLCTLMGSFCSLYKVSAKKITEEVSLMTLTSDAKKNWLAFSSMIWGLWWIFAQPFKSLKFFFRWTLFVQSIQGLSYKNTESYLSWHRTVMENLNKCWPCGFKNGIRNWVNVH